MINLSDLITAIEMSYISNPNDKKTIKQLKIRLMKEYTSRMKHIKHLAIRIRLLDIKIMELDIFDYTFKEMILNSEKRYNLVQEFKKYVKSL